MNLNDHQDQVNENDVMENQELSEPIPGELPKATPKTSKAKGIFLLLLSMCVFVLSIGVCMILITKSADVEPLPPISVGISPMAYSVNVEQVSPEDVPPEFFAPESKTESSLVNFLFISVDEDESNMMILASVDMETKAVALLSFPRDTYITGDYEIPKLRNVFADAQENGRGVQAVNEKAREMIGFWPDYYIVLDDAALNQVFEITGDIAFTVPEEPKYTNLTAGELSMNSHSAMQLFSCRSSYNVVETQSAELQRELLITIMQSLFLQNNSVSENAQLLAQSIDTNLSASQIGYMLFFLQDVAPSSVASVTLPGEVVTLEDGKNYYQVVPQEAADLLNSFFNPKKSQITIYDVNFRQVAGSSGEGEWEEYGWGHGGGDGTRPTTRPTDDEDDEEDEDPTTSPDDTDSTEPAPVVDPTAPTISELP